MLISVLSCGCNEGIDNEPGPTLVGNATGEIEIKVHGNLRQMMHEGKTGAAVQLDTLLPNEHLFAVGALADLAGEVTIIDGAAYLSYPDGVQKARTNKLTESDAAAALLVSAQVNDWQTVETDREIPFAELDDELARLAEAAGLYVDQRIPFRIEGDFRDLRWHVIDGSRLPEGPSSHADHVKAAVQLHLDDGPASLVGFFSKNDAGVFTHMGSHSHIHCMVAKPLSAGHVDHVIVPAGAKVMFPKISR